MHIPDQADNDPYRLDLFLCSNPDNCSLSPHPPLETSDHLVISADIPVDVSINEHLNHRNVYSFNNADWDGFRDYLWA